jgi:mRNA-degrading endonuclease RelE of RelBE toxin-antitoxin system
MGRVALQAEEKESNQSLTISAEDLDAALRLLEDEERAASVDGGVVSLVGFVISFFTYVFLLVGFGALVSGLTMVWFSPWGLRLLAVAGVAILVLFLLLLFYVRFMDGKDVSDSIKRVRKEIGEGEFVKVSDALFKKRKDDESLGVFGGLTILLGCFAVAFSPFAAWFAADRLLRLSLAVEGLSCLVLALLFTADEYRELKHLKRVSRLRERFEAGQLSEGEGQGGVTVTRGEMELLGRAETKRAAREAAKVFEESGAEAESFYSVAYAREALYALEREENVERRQRIREAVDSLQFDPRPARAHGDGGQFVIEGDDYFVRYEVNDEKERLLVTAVGAREVTNAS